MKKPVDIFLVNYNGIEFLLPCLQTIKKHTVYRNYNVLVFDNASTDGSIEKLLGLRWIELIANQQNIGPIAAWNRMLELLRQRYGSLENRYILLLGEDTLVNKGWLRTLMNRAEANPEIGIVSFGNMCNPPALELKEVPSFSFDCTLIRGECVDDIGWFDERLFCYFEDGFFCIKARHKGWKIVATPENLVEHLGSCIVRKIPGWRENQLQRDLQVQGKIAEELHQKGML